MVNSTVFKAGKQSSAVVNIGPTSYKIIDTMKKEKLQSLKPSES